jgi:hypothetical protein
VAVEGWWVFTLRCHRLNNTVHSADGNPVSVGPIPVVLTPGGRQEKEAVLSGVTGGGDIARGKRPRLL